ncbi:MAG: methylated-DNA--[protein]-cysteine S-methyltransferase [Pseudobdellovibrionaceae bacterium]
MKDSRNPYEVIARAIDEIVTGDMMGASLQDFGMRYGYESTYFSKIFQEYTGLTPRDFQRFAKMRKARDFLLKGYTTLDAAYEAGLSGQGRLHDSCLKFDNLTPGEIRKKGLGMTIWHDEIDTVIGRLLIAVNARGLCWIAFLDKTYRDEAYMRMKYALPYASYLRDPQETAETTQKLQSLLSGKNLDDPLEICLAGTIFQMQVWQALLKIPEGATVNYQAIAKAIGRPKASRAVGSAVGANPLTWLIPCHRVIQASGIIDNYGWGTDRKAVLLGWEAQNN